MRGPRLSVRGSKNSAWKGGRTLLKTGYIRVRMMPDDPLFHMGSVKKDGRSGYVLEHRLIMARQIGRPLERWEIVHHKNGIRTDNRIENLELLSGKNARQEHMATILLQQENEALRKRISNLEARVTLLEAERVLAEKV